MIGPENLEILQPLGADQATFVARDSSTGSARLVVVERVTRTSPVPAARAELLRRGRALKALEHPKVVRVRDVFERDGEVVVVSDYVDGEWLSALMMMNPRPPVTVMLRFVVDVLEALGALHELKDDRNQPLGFVHGAIGPDTVLVADDGVAEVARTCRLPRPGTNERYVPPELRRGDGPAEVRSDVYAAGAILRDVLAAAPGDAGWAEPLTEIAWRACSVDVESRWPSAAAMATAVRRIAGSRLASAATAADFVKKRFGERIRGRRTAFEALQRDSAPPPSSEPLSLKPSEMELLEPSQPSLAGNTPPLPLVFPEPSPSSPVASPPAPVASPPAPAAAHAPAKKPSLAVEPEAHDPDAEPATRRRPGPTTLIGQPPVPPVALAVAPVAAAASPPTRPPAAPQVSLPPPTIVPDEATPAIAGESYRRRMPTFPTYEEPEPPRRGKALRGIIAGSAMVLTFLVGWWVGRTYAPVPEVPQAVCPSVPARVAALTPPPPPAVTPPVATAIETPAASAGATASAPPPATVAMPAPTAAPQPSPTTTVAPQPTAPYVTPRPAPTAIVPTPTATPTAAPTHTAAPRPSAKPGYVPEEL
jgi:hypothetical protein